MEEAMSLNSFLAPVLPQFPAVAEDGEVEILHELPTETLYLALKKADAQALAWFYASASPEQVQGILDLDCWKGAEFLGTRFESAFKNMVAAHPVKLHQFMKKLDPEIVVRGLLGLCRVIDFDPQDPPQLSENQFLVSPDSRYALILETSDPELRELLLQWMSKMASADLELLQRHLESCKWEQISDLEEFGFRIKKGRLEELGFVDRTEAISLYARGNGVTFKEKLLKNPLPEGTKRSSLQSPVESSEGGISADDLIHSAFLPDILSEPLFGEGLLSLALNFVQPPHFKQLLLAEILRTFNGVLAADEVIHEDLEPIAASIQRARRYIDLGLSYLSDGKPETAATHLENYPVGEIFRLGWLVTQDLVRVAAELRNNSGENFFGRSDTAMLAALKGRHPELSPDQRQRLGIASSTLLTTEAILKTGTRLSQLAQMAAFTHKDLAAVLQAKEHPLMPEESLFARLLSALFREAAGAEPVGSPLKGTEWDHLAAAFLQRNGKQKLESSVHLILERVPAHIRLPFEHGLKEVVQELTSFLENKPQGRPDPRFFRALAIVPDTGAMA